MGARGVSKEQKQKAREDAIKAKLAKLTRGRPNNTAENKKKRMERDAQLKAEAAQNREQRAIQREKWRKEARKTSKNGWEPTFEMWLNLKKWEAANA